MDGTGAGARDLVVAVDVGGTCTDCVVLRAGEPVRVGKTFSTPPDFADGVIDSVRTAGGAMDLDLGALLRRTRLFLHGSTVVDNAIITRDGAATGLITTAGFEDTLIMTRGGYGRWSGQPEEVIKHPVITDRPPPLVPPARICGVSERIDCRGEVLVPLDEEDVAAAATALRRAGVEAVAICLLWSFRNPAHEWRARDIVQSVAPDLHVSISSDVAPVPGEYERTSTTVINAYGGKVARGYLERLAARLSECGYGGPVLVMQGYGGLVAVEEAALRPVGMIECGPAAGLIGAQHLGRRLGQRNVIAADMGGTTFKVGVVQDGALEYAREPMVDRFHYMAPKLEVVSIGAGGGSIVGVDPRTRGPKIGPQSAGARPGPVCYGRGGTEPTLTDVAAIIGYLDAGMFLGGTVPLDLARARAVFAEKVARPLGLPVEEAAIGIYRIACAQIADLVRNVTVERGLDPRDFVLHAFGGSCGLFAAAFAKDLAIPRIVVPYTASVNCAFGMVTADVVHEYSRVRTMAAPAPAGDVNAILVEMEDRAWADLTRAGFLGERIALEWLVDLRYRRQVHQVTTPLRCGPPLAERDLKCLLRDFEALYERRYGRGSAYAAAGVELVAFRLRARGVLERPADAPIAESVADASAGELGQRLIFVDSAAAMRPAKVYDFSRLRPGNVVRGAAVVHTPITTVVVQTDQIARMDSYRNLVLEAA